MKQILLTLILSAGVAGAELSADEFNEVRNFALSLGYYYDGTSRIGSTRYHTFCNEKEDLIAFVPMFVTSTREARTAMVASNATFFVCRERWKKELGRYLRREIPLPPPGFEPDYSNDGVVSRE
jgi:hypothetical protein